MEELSELRREGAKHGVPYSWTLSRERVLEILRGHYLAQYPSLLDSVAQLERTTHDQRMVAAAIEAKKEYSELDEAVSAYSDESPYCVEMLVAVIEHKIKARPAWSGEVGVLLLEKLHRLWSKVEELDLALVRTPLMCHNVQPNYMGEAWLHNYAALLVYQRMTGRATAAGLEPCGPGSDHERNLACSASMTVLTSQEKYLSWK